MPNMIFISYREKDSNNQVTHLDRDLTREFGAAAVFRDKTRLRGGEVWTKVLEDNAQSCPVMLVVIGPGWKTASFDKGKLEGFPRLSDKNDWVRKEITLSLKSGNTVIPVRLDNTAMPDQEWLANFNLEALAEQQSVFLRSNDYEGDLAKLVQRLREVCPGLPPRPQDDAPPRWRKANPQTYLEDLRLPSAETFAAPQTRVVEAAGLGVGPAGPDGLANSTRPTTRGWTWCRPLKLMPFQSMNPAPPQAAATRRVSWSNSVSILAAGGITS